MISSTQYQPDFVTAPGETLQETLEVLGMSQAEAANRMGRPLKTINEIIKGKAAITPDTALQLERITSVPASFWNAREARYREFLAFEAERKRLEHQDEWLNQLPVSKMVKLGWVAKGQSNVEQARHLLTFFSVATPELLEQRVYVQFRQSVKRKANPWAQLAWLRRGTIEGAQIPCSPYQSDVFRSALQEARTLTRSDLHDSTQALTEICRQAGVAVVYVPELPNTCAWGATRWITSTKALIQLSMRYKTDDHFWFTFFHEAAHVLKHGKRDEFVECDADDADLQHEKESQADRFAAEFLIPSARLNEFLAERWKSKAAVNRFASRIGVAPGIVVGRLQHEGHLPHSHFNDLKRRIEFSRGATV